MRKGCTVPFFRPPHHNRILGSLYFYTIVTDVKVSTIVFFWVTPFPCCPCDTKCLRASLIVGVPALAGCGKHFTLMLMEIYVPRVVYSKIPTWWRHFYTIENMPELTIADSVDPSVL